MSLFAVAFWGLFFLLMMWGLVSAVDVAHAWWDGRHFRRRLREQRRQEQES